MKQKKALKPVEGWIYLKAEGRWAGKYKDRSKKGGYGYVYAHTESECIEKLNKAVTKRDMYLETIYTHDYFEDWFENIVRPNLKPKWATQKKTTIDRYIIGLMPNKPLQDVHFMELRNLLMSIEKSNTRHKVKSILQETFRDAFNGGIIPLNPMAIVKIPPHVQNRGQALTEDEKEQFFEDIQGDKFEDFFIFSYLVGGRRGEVYNFNPSTDIDFENGFIYLRGTKNKTSNRVLPMFSDLEEFLRKKDLTVNTWWDFHIDSATKRFKKFCPNHSLKDLRHTFATECMEAGVKNKVFSEWLGHASVETTNNIYTHVRTDFNKSEADKMNNRYK